MAILVRDGVGGSRYRSCRQKRRDCRPDVGTERERIDMNEARSLHSPPGVPGCSWWSRTTAPAQWTTVPESMPVTGPLPTAACR